MGRIGWKGECKGGTAKVTQGVLGRKRRQNKRGAKEVRPRKGTAQLLWRDSRTGGRTRWATAKTEKPKSDQVIKHLP